MTVGRHEHAHLDEQTATPELTSIAVVGPTGSRPGQDAGEEEIAALRAQCARFETALDKIVQGVCFFNKDRH